jgi:hypothetical protein
LNGVSLCDLSFDESGKYTIGLTKIDDVHKFCRIALAVIDDLPTGESLIDGLPAVSGAVLKPKEFTRLCVLMRDLAPALVYLVKPENAGKIQRGEREPTLENLRTILERAPDSRPLFAT